MAFKWDQFPQGAVLDEVQRSPLLFSYLQEILDNNKEPGRFILTGSNNFLINVQISQTLAGITTYIRTYVERDVSHIPAKLDGCYNNLLVTIYPPISINARNIAHPESGTATDGSPS